MCKINSLPRFILIFVNLLIFFSIYSNAQTLKGRILDQNNNLIIGATIFNSSLKKAIISDSSGRFKIHSKKGENKYIISFVGFKPKVLNITFENEDFIETEIILRSDESLKEVVVSGTLKNVSKLNSTVPVEIGRASCRERV